jgi:hypothetical protein
LNATLELLGGASSEGDRLGLGVVQNEATPAVDGHEVFVLERQGYTEIEARYKVARGERDLRGGEGGSTKSPKAEECHEDALRLVDQLHPRGGFPAAVEAVRR